MITGNIDINAIKMKEKLDFGGKGIFRRENKPLPMLTPEERVKNKKIKEVGEAMLDNFLKKRSVMHERAPVVPCRVMTNERMHLNLIEKD